jgi:mannan endo-1,4-beta-mannosidase
MKKHPKTRFMAMNIPIRLRTSDSAPNFSHHTTRRLSGGICGVLLLIAGIVLAPVHVRAQSADELIRYLRSLGNGQYLFGQVATWVHNENPDMDHESNWLRKVHDHTGLYPRYACITYDFHDDPFSDAEWNAGVKKIHDKGMIAGVYNFWANPCGGAWNDPCESEQIRAPGDNPVKAHFYRQMDRMAANLQWLKEQGVTVIYTPFVESEDRNKWHAKQGSENIIQLYRVVHDYFEKTKGLDNIVWAYHTTQRPGALEACYPGDEYVDVIGKSAYGSGLIFEEYEWALEKKKNHGKVIWWAELGIRGREEAPRDCMDVLQKLESTFPDLAGFVFWSDDGFYNVVGNLNGPEFMAHPKIITLPEK